MAVPKILVTGASGFIGRNLKEQLAADYELLAPTRQELDLLDGEAVRAYLRAHQFDAVLHAATWNATATSTKDRSQVLAHNCRLFFNLTRCATDYGKLIYYGSGAEYDRGHWQALMPEGYFDSHVPADDYGFSKYIMTKYATCLPNVVNLRLFAVYGKYEDWRIRFISNACCKAVWDLPITIRQNVFFDYLYIDDLVRLTRWFIGSQPAHPAYNVCTSQPRDLLGLARQVLAVANKELEIVVARPGLGAPYSGDNCRLLSHLGGDFAFTPIEAGISRLYHWYLTNKHTIDRDQLLVDP